MKGYLTIVPMAPKKVDQTKREPEDEEGPAAKKPKIEQDSPAAGGSEEKREGDAEQNSSGTPAEGGKKDDAELDSDEAEKAENYLPRLNAEPMCPHAKTGFKKLKLR